jgi:hypothetical protein
VLRFNFNPKKSTQAAAYLLKLNEGDMDKYLWIKMLYWADRESIAKWGEPITGDNAASMPYGQVLSTIYDLTKGARPDLRSYWDRFISDADADTNRIKLKADPGEDDLSKAELDILKATFERFKDFIFRQTLEFFGALPEHEAITAGSKPLPVERIFKALGKTDAEIQEAEREYLQAQFADMLLGRS